METQSRLALWGMELQYQGTMTWILWSILRVSRKRREGRREKVMIDDFQV